MFEKLTIGDTVRIPIEVTDIDGNLADPVALRLLVLPPKSALISLELQDLTRTSTGIFHYDLRLTAPGDWYTSIEVGSPVCAVLDDVITVQPSRFRP